METRLLGSKGPMVSVMGYGVMSLRELTYPQAEKLLNTALDIGVTLIDSSPCYGLAEKYVGRAIGKRRGEYVLATKCGCNVDHEGCFLDKQDHLFTEEQIIHNVEQSLCDLQTDVLDLVQLHGIMPESILPQHMDGVICAMEKLKRQGKVKQFGFSCRNGIPGERMYPHHYCLPAANAFLPMPQLEVIQLVYSLFLEQNESIIQRATELGKGVMVRGAVRRYHSDYESIFQRAGLGEFLDEGQTMEDLMMEYVLNTPGVSACIFGTGNMAHLKRNVEQGSRPAWTLEMYREVKSRLKQIL